MPWYILFTPPYKWISVTSSLTPVSPSLLPPPLPIPLPPHLPLGILVHQQFSLVRPWEHHEAPVQHVHLLHGCPRTHDAIGRSERKVVEIWEQKQVKICPLVAIALASLHIPWCSGWRDVLVPGSGGLLISMVCIAMTLGPVKPSTMRRISGWLQYLNSVGSSWKSCSLVTARSLAPNSVFVIATSFMMVRPGTCGHGGNMAPDWL